MKLSQIKPSSKRASSFLLISPQGVGKTVAACSFPKPRLYDVEGKLESVVNWYNQPEFKKFAEDIDIVTISDVLYFVYNTLEDMIKEQKRPSFETIIVDSVTNISRDVVNVMLSSRRSTASSGGKNDRAKIVPGNIIVPSWDEFDGEDTVLGTMLGYLITLQKRWGINVVCIAHPHSVSGPSGTQQGRIVAKGHKAPQTVLNYFQEIYHLDRSVGINTGDGVRRICMTQSGLYSRTAWHFLPAQFDFTDKPFYEVLRGYLDANLGGETNENVTVETQIAEVQKQEGPQTL